MEIKMTAIPGGKKGKVGKISIKPGDKVNAGDILVQVEISKGNKPIRAAAEGVITKLLCQEGDEVVSGQTLAEMSEAAQNASEETVKAPHEMEELTTELLIIGGGPGGYVAAICAAKKGLKVILVEKEELGGTCLNVGCIPTKALVKSSEICRNIRESSLFGIIADGNPRVNMEQIIRRKDEIRSNLVSGIRSLMEQNRIIVICGEASFISPDKVYVKGERNYVISAKDTIVATGSKCSKVNIPGIELPVVINSTDALSCTTLPQTVTIVGGGVIGMEFAFIYHNLGVKVHVVEFMDRLLTMMDSEVSHSIQTIAKDNGISVYTKSKVISIQQAEDGQAIVTYSDANGEHAIVSDKVLVAIGREPRLDGLDIEKAGVTLNDRGRGIAVDAHMRTNVEHIYAVGDVTNIMQLAHVASHQGMIAVENILGSSVQMDYSAVPNVVFTSPEIAGVGLTLEACREKGIDCSESTVSYASNGKALTMNEPEGFIKLVRDNSTNKIVGGSIIGADASSLISTLTLAITNGMTDKDIEKTIFTHPTTAEIIHEAALGFGIGAIHQI
ncbi:MAG: dihydrolipoyl dehydrogenase [Clostridiaceae bacterium]|nr:dihydrolipoyl dehydrogenase [Clostridiaceae bacterium]